MITELTETSVSNVQQQLIAQISSPTWSWDEACEMGISARNMRDLSNWIIGTVALGIETKWGEDRLGEFARIIGLNKNTVSQYRWVVKKFGLDYDVIYGLPWSYYRLAAGTEYPEETIEQFHDRSMSITEAERFVKGLPLVPSKNKTSFSIKIECHTDNADAIQALLNKIEEDERLYVYYRRQDS